MASEFHAILAKILKMHVLIDWLLRLDILILLALALACAWRCRATKEPKILALGFISLLGAVAGIDAVFVEPNILTVKQTSLIINKFSRPVKIALLGDPHAGPYVSQALVKKAANKIIAQNPDLVLLSGDYFFEDEFEKYQNYLDPLQELSKKYPVYAVLGNHEYGLAYNTHAFIYGEAKHELIADKLRSLGIKVLINEAVDLDVKGQKLKLVGAHELWLVSSKRLRELFGLFGRAEAESAVIVLAHNPDLIYELPPGKIDVFLAGHTHGGQVRLPFIGALGDSWNRLPKKFYKGLSRWGKTQMFVTSGIGESGFGVRFFNPPQIDILEIQ